MKNGYAMVCRLKLTPFELRVAIEALLSELKIRIFKILSVLAFIVFITAGMLLIGRISSISNVIYFTLMSVLFLLFLKNKNERRNKNEGA